MKNQTFIITAAGGNGTAIQVLDHSLPRAEYSARGKELGSKMESFGAEQAGFLIPAINHFEMGGGEFCGNAARSAAILFSEIQQSSKVSFTMSGYTGKVLAAIQKIDSHHYFVECAFPSLPADQRDILLSNGQSAKIVDLGGIVHVVLEAQFPSEPTVYQLAHRAIVKELGFEERGAVGVIWIERTESAIKMHPVVWVKDVDTFFYEQSCGSGTIAVSKVTGVHSIIQPTGQSIEAEINRGEIILRSNMEITRESN